MKYLNDDMQKLVWVFKRFNLLYVNEKTAEVKTSSKNSSSSEKTLSQTYTQGAACYELSASQYFS